MERARVGEELESADHGMTENTDQTNHPWNTLTTITTFDQGIGNNTSTLRLSNVNESHSNAQIIQRRTPSLGILIESLIQQLCTMLEGDNVHRNKLFYAICDKLYESKLIDNSYNMMEFEGLRGQYQHTLYRLITIARAMIGSESALHVPNCLMSESSRYRREFREISYIASGGFGHVYKAQHRLDGIEYAIKKIIVSHGRVEVIKQHLDEVKTLAKLNHANIVSYKAAWIEPMFPVPSFISGTSIVDESHKSRISEYRKKSKSYNSQSVKHSYSNTYNLNLSDNNKQDIIFDNKATYITGMHMNMKIKQQNKMHRSGGGFSHDIINERFQELNSSTNIIGKRIVEENSLRECTKEVNSDIVSFRNSNSNENLDQTIEEVSSDIVSFRNSNSNENLNQTIEEVSSDVVSFRNSNSNENSDQSIDKNAYAIDHNYSNKEFNSYQDLCTYTSKKQYMTLYIQMSLCEQTLEQWMRGRISITPELMVGAILQQILCGIDYIHSQKIVHHDIKPSNIFISTSGKLQIQLGDFGLACPLQRESHHSVIGTQMYAAPEQLQGKCDPKSDIYSVGIVLIELLIPMQTQMELSSVIKCFKHGNIPEAFTIERHKWAQMVTRLVQENPNKRPCADQLLQDINNEKDVVITGLKDTVVILENDNHDKDNTIHALQDKIALLEEEVKKLKLSQETTIK